jgi:hypothetical protein
MERSPEGNGPSSPHSDDRPSKGKEKATVDLEDHCIICLSPIVDKVCQVAQLVCLESVADLRLTQRVGIDCLGPMRARPILLQMHRSLVRTPIRRRGSTSEMSFVSDRHPLSHTQHSKQPRLPKGSVLASRCSDTGLLCVIPTVLSATFLGPAETLRSSNDATQSATETRVGSRSRRCAARVD